MSMSTRKINAIVLGGSALLGVVLSAYYAILAAPAAVAARPALAELGFWTALFSGRFTDWLFFNHPLIGSTIIVTFWLLAGGVLIWTAR